MKRRAERLGGLGVSGIVTMRRACEAVGGINLASGTCELGAPRALLEAAGAAVAGGLNSYAFPEGVAALRRGVTELLAREGGPPVDPREVVVTVGATAAYSATLMGLLDPGDGVVLVEPYYAWHYNALSLAGCVPEFVRVEAPGYRLTRGALAAAVTPRTRALVVCTPGNPTGRVLDGDELEAIADVATQHDLLVISDEVYDQLVYDGCSHVSPRAHPKLRDRTVVLKSFSKTFHVTGWRVGCAIGREDLVGAVALAHDFFDTCAPTPLQHALARMLEVAGDYYDRLRASYAERREVMCEALAAAGLAPSVPEGAYYVLADVRARGFADADVASRALLERVGIAVTPESAFVRAGQPSRFVRLCFARELDELREAGRRLRRL